MSPARRPNSSRAARAALVLALAALATALPACKDSRGPSKAQKAQAKLQKEQDLLALPYPKSTGILPKSIAVAYDSATDRSTMTMQLTSLRAAGASSGGVGSITLHLSSSYKGTMRANDNPEGSVDARVVARCTSPGLLSFAGDPGAIVLGAERRPFKPASGKGAYVSSKIGAAWEESVSFRIPTADLVAAANADRFTLTVGGIEFQLIADAKADWREFAARLNPRP